MTIYTKVIEYTSDGLPEMPAAMVTRLDDETVKVGAFDKAHLNDITSEFTETTHPDEGLTHFTVEEITAFNRPGITDAVTGEVVAEQYRLAGGNAVQADADIQANVNIPPEIKAMNAATIQMHYLQFVALTGDRIQSIEDEYFPV